MVSRKLHLKEKVYFIDPKRGVCLGTIRGLTDTEATLAYKAGDEKLSITLPLEQLSLERQPLESEWNWSSKYQNIPEQYAKAFDNVQWDGDILHFLYENLKPEAKETARKMIQNYYSYDIEEWKE